MNKSVHTCILLVVSNIFMTIAWYGHLKFKNFSWFNQLNLASIIFISWGIALIEYSFLIPANKIGYIDNGGPYNLWQLKVIQESITLVIFTIFTVIFFKTETLRMNHLIGFCFLILAVYFIFKK